MATIITRETTGAGATTNKGSPLLNSEVDNNFMNLNVELAGKAPLANPTFTGTITTPELNFSRATNIASGIQWYNPTYSAWTTYMGQAGIANQSPNGLITPPAGTLVTGWGIRNHIERVAGYGWTFESGASNSNTPTIVAEISALDGSAKFNGAVSVASLKVGNTEVINSVGLIDYAKITNIPTITATVVSDTPPVAPVADMVWMTTAGETFVYIVDGAKSYWLETGLPSMPIDYVSDALWDLELLDGGRSSLSDTVNITLDGESSAPTYDMLSGAFDNQYSTLTGIEVFYTAGNSAAIFDSLILNGGSSLTN